MRRLALLLAIGLTACGGKHPGSYSSAGATEQGTSDSAAIEAADALWAERADEARLQEAIKAYESVHAADPGNRHALVRLTRAWYLWGDAFTQDKEAKVERWGKSIEYGTKCISLNPDVGSQIAQGAKEKDAIQAAKKEDAGCIYWTATALGKWGKIQSLSKTLKHLPTVKAYVSKVEELDPSYFHYGPARYWAAYYAALPSFAGQDLDKSAEYFDAAINAAPFYLATRVLRAEYWSVSTQNVAQFDEDIAFVLGADPDMKPEADVTAENVLEIEKAKALKAKRHELFDKKALEAAGTTAAN